MCNKRIWPELILIPIALLVLAVALLAPSGDGHASSYALGMACGMLTACGGLLARRLIVSRNPEAQKKARARNDERAQMQRLIGGYVGYAACILAAATFSLLGRYGVVTSAYAAGLGIMVCGMVGFAVALIVQRMKG